MTDQEKDEYFGLTWFFENPDGATSENVLKIFHGERGRYRGSLSHNILINSHYVLGEKVGSDYIYRITDAGKNRLEELINMEEAEERDDDLKDQTMKVNEMVIKSSESAIKTNESVLATNKWTLRIAALALIVSAASIVAPYLKNDAPDLQDWKTTNELLKQQVQELKEIKDQLNYVKHDTPPDTTRRK